ncbi:hypothetical protein MTR67_019280 [Solanum verrucosum]|uniref:Uncharacterized protein n=1 Tax=Solanum verrucosum TaxID=315347 RepID=A0AAF0QNW1_SOLVR|nr:hypothetical protein MTR67_019280 [Solanum verrucosum]
MLFDVLMISSQVQRAGPLQSMNTRPVVKVLYSWKAVCVRRLVKLQSTPAIRSNEVSCSLDNNFSCLNISKNKQQIIHSFKERVFQASRTTRDLIHFFKSFLYQLLLCLLVIVLTL